MVQGVDVDAYEAFRYWIETQRPRGPPYELSGTCFPAVCQRVSLRGPSDYLVPSSALPGSNADIPAKA